MNAPDPKSTPRLSIITQVIIKIYAKARNKNKSSPGGHFDQLNKSAPIEVDLIQLKIRD